MKLDAGKTIHDNKKFILQRWETEVRQNIESARDLNHPEIIDTLPAILENLSRALSPSNQAADMIDSTLANEHGGERARLTDFDLTAVINEFRILRSVIIDFLSENGKVSEEEKRKIHQFIDQAIETSATAFSLVQSQMREQIIATLAHDMRAPLTASTLSADSIIRKSDDEKIVYHARKVLVNNRRIDNMIQDLLNASLIKAGRNIQITKEEVNLKEIIEETIEDLIAPLQKRVILNLQDFSGHWDKNYMKRAIENLIMNAFKYGDKSREITITTSLENERALIKVHNFGPPIPKEEQETIFQIYRRAETAKGTQRPGWGLGLPIVRAVAEAHRGSIAVTSFENHGTTFILDIPQSV